MSDLSIRHEREVAEKLAGWATLASGAVREPLDVWTGEPGAAIRLVVSNKLTIGKGLRVDVPMWREVEAASVSTGLRGALALRIYDLPDRFSMRGRPKVDLIAVSVDDMAEMLYLING